MGFKEEIRKSHSRVFRQVFIKRRLLSTGLFEPDWFEVTKDCKRFGKIKRAIDAFRRNKFRFSSNKMVFANDEGQFNPEDDEGSHWFGFSSQQRTLVRITAGFINQSFTNGIWTNVKTPDISQWDISKWDEDPWSASPSTFIGIVSGDIIVSDKNEVALNVKPLNQIFKDFAARNLDGFTSTGLTASQLINAIRDQTDGAGSFIFRPFFGDTTGNWEITPTTNVYSGLDSAGAAQVRDRDVWSLIEKVSEAENFVPFVSSDGIFKFKSRDATSTIAFEFHGLGSVNKEFGHTIKKINAFAPRLTKFYSRIEVKHKAANTTTSLEIVESTMTVASNNLSWLLGQRTFKIDNTLIDNSTTATNIATTVFNEASSLKKELNISTSFVPQLELLNRVSVTYDSTPERAESLWDENSWADTIGAGTPVIDALIWDNSRGDAIRLNAKEFKILSEEIDLDKLECKFGLREE